MEISIFIIFESVNLVRNQKHSPTLIQGDPIDMLHKSLNAPVPYPTMHHFVREMCACVHISATKRCSVEYLSNARCDLSICSVVTITNNNKGSICKGAVSVMLCAIMWNIKHIGCVQTPVFGDLKIIGV